MENAKKNSQDQKELIQSLDYQNNKAFPFHNILSKIQVLKQQKLDKKQASLTHSPKTSFSLLNYKIDPIFKLNKLKNIFEMLELNCYSFSFSKLFCAHETEENFNKKTLDTNNKKIGNQTSFYKYNTLFQEIANFSNKNKEQKGNKSSLIWKINVNRKILPFTKKKLIINKNNLILSKGEGEDNMKSEYYIDKIKENNTIELNLKTLSKKDNISKYNTFYNNAFYMEKMDNFNKKLRDLPITENNFNLFKKKETDNFSLEKRQIFKTNRDIFTKRKKVFIIRDPNTFRSTSIW
jgi:hypothetical protein